MNKYSENYRIRGVVSLLIINILAIIVTILRVVHIHEAGIPELVTGIMLVILYCVLADYAFVAGTLLLGRIELRDGMRILLPAIVIHVAILAIVANTMGDMLIFVGFVPPIATAVVIVFTLQCTALNK